MMNTTIYVFGKFGGGYTQYPDDYTHDLFYSYENQIIGQSQMMIRREDNVLYYSYIRRLSERDKFIGICLSFNGVSCTDVLSLSKLLEENITNMVINGDILQFADNGDIISKVDKLYKVRGPFKRLSDSLYSQLQKNDFKFIKLPSANLAISSTEIKQIHQNTSNSDNTGINKQINEAIKSYYNIFVFLDETGFALNSYSSKLKALYVTNKLLNKENEKINKEKKQYKLLFWIIVSFVVLSVWFSFTYTNMSGRIGNLRAAVGNKEDTIQMLNDLVEQEQVQIFDLEKSVNYLSMMTDSLGNQVETMLHQIDSLHNFTVLLKNDKEKTENKLKQVENERRDAELSLSRTRKEYDGYIKRMSEVLSNNTIKFNISDLEIANAYSDGKIETSYGEKIKSRNTRFLKPRITVDSYQMGNVTLYIKLYTPSGILSTGKTSPIGYSTYSQLSLSKQSNVKYELQGWGGDDRGHWKSGLYRYEIWYQGVCIKTKMFTIY